MNLFVNHDQHDVSNSFDQDFGTLHSLTVVDTHHHSIPFLDINSFDHSHDFFHMSDPLKYAYQFPVKPFTIDLGHTHFVKPHYVNGYVREDGTVVEAYFRDGDGNTSINRTEEQGGGYLRSNPDGNPFNNLG